MASFALSPWVPATAYVAAWRSKIPVRPFPRSEEHTSELQSRGQLVCRLLLEKKKSDTGVIAPHRRRASSRRSPSFSQRRCLFIPRRLPVCALFPYTTLFRSQFVEDGLTFEVQQQLGDGVVRTIAMGSSDGVRRGMAVKNTGAPISEIGRAHV